MALEVTGIDSYNHSCSTGLLVSILLRYPEVGTISCSQKQQSLILKFLISKDCDFPALKNKLTLALEMFNRIEGRKIKVCNIEKHEQELDLLVITRDLGTITQNEMNLIVAIIKDELGKQLITEESELAEDDIVFQEELISHMLATIRSNGTEKNVTAIREDGRVLVFNG